VASQRISASVIDAEPDQLPGKLSCSEAYYFVARSCCGVCIGLRSNTPALLGILARMVPGSRCERPVEVMFSIYESSRQNTARRYEIAFNAKIAPARFRLVEALHLLRSYIQETVAILSRNFVLVHAAVVGWKGHAVLLPGASGSGKSTLTMALVEQGAAYYSDELAVIDENGYVHPYLRAPNLRSSLGQEAAKRTTASIVASDLCPEPLKIGLVVLSRYSEQANCESRTLLCREIFFGLLANTLAARSRPGLSLRVLKEVSLHGRGVQLERGEARIAANAVLRMM